MFLSVQIIFMYSFKLKNSRTYKNHEKDKQ